MNLGIIKVAKPIVSKIAFVANKHLPTILTVVGSAGLVTTTVLAMKATPKVEACVAYTKDKLDILEQKNALGVDADGNLYDKNNYDKELMTTKVQGITLIAKVYAPVVILGTTSLVCIFGGHYMMLKRLAAMTSAYASVAASYSDYRKRVIDDLGIEADRKYRFDIHDDAQVVETITNEDGTETQVIDSVATKHDHKGGTFSFLFSEETSKIYQKDDRRMNVFNVRRIQQMMDDQLKIYGHLFLNDVLIALGLDPVQEGQVIGWSMKGDGDHFVDLGLNDGIENVRWTNCEEDNIWLFFNCDNEPVLASLPKARI